MKHQTRKIRAGAQGRIGSIRTGYPANFHQKSHGAGLMNAHPPEIKQGPRVESVFRVLGQKTLYF
jgi:hypothetical protein